MLEPSARNSDLYQATKLLTREDELFVGRLEAQESDSVRMRTLPPESELSQVERDEIAILRPHPYSRMPYALLDTFERGEVLERLAGPVD